MPDLLYSEKKLAEILGLSRDDLRHARKTSLKKGPHFIEQRGKETAITVPGLAKLLEYWRATGFTLSISMESRIHEAELNDPKPWPGVWSGRPGTPDPEPPTPAPAQLIVTRTFPNLHILEARYAGPPLDARRVRVWVKSNKNFVPNMRIAGRPKAPGSDHFTLVGRCPRRKGRAL